MENQQILGRQKNTPRKCVSLARLLINYVTFGMLFSSQSQDFYLLDHWPIPPLACCWGVHYNNIFNAKQNHSSWAENIVTITNILIASFWASCPNEFNPLQNLKRERFPPYFCPWDRKEIEAQRRELFGLFFESRSWVWIENPGFMTLMIMSLDSAPSVLQGEREFN